MIVHAIGNANPGGVQTGFDSLSYHAPGENIAPVAAAPQDAARKMMKTGQSITLS